MGYISSSTFFKTGSGKPLRQHLLSEAKLESIVDFGDLQVFEGVTTYPAVLVIEKGSPTPDHALQFLALKSLPDTDLAAEFEASAQPMPQSNLSIDSWQLQDNSLSALRQKIIECKPTLKEVYGSPYRGILTGLNEAFVIDRATRDRLIAEEPAAEEIIKPFLEGKDLKKWRVEPRERYLIFTRRGIRIEQYPSVLSYLSQYRERLSPKPKDWQPTHKEDMQIAHSVGAMIANLFGQ